MTPLRLIPLLLCLLPLGLAVSSSRPQEPGAPTGQGLVQLRLEGSVLEGQRARVEVVHRSPRGPERVEVEAFLAPGTGADELGVLLERRLGMGGVAVVRGGSSETGTSLFLDAVESLSVEVGGGLTGILTACDSAPALMRVSSVRAGSDRVEEILEVVVDTVSRHDGTRGLTKLTLDLPRAANAPLVTGMLMEAAVEAGLLSDKPGGDAWRPVKTRSGELIGGLSVRLQSDGGWRIDLEL